MPLMPFAIILEDIDQVIQSDLYIPNLEVTIRLWRGHFFTIPKRTRFESPGKEHFLNFQSFRLFFPIFKDGWMSRFKKNMTGWPGKKHVILEKVLDSKQMALYGKFGWWIYVWNRWCYVYTMMILYLLYIYMCIYIHICILLYIYAPRTQMTNLFEGQPVKTRRFFSTQKRVIWVPGIIYMFKYTYVFRVLLLILHTNDHFTWMICVCCWHWHR